MKKNINVTSCDIERLEDKINNAVKEMKDDNLSMKVEILGELQKMREDDAAHKYSHQRVNDDIEELQDRVDKLEVAS